MIANDAGDYMRTASLLVLTAHSTNTCKKQSKGACGQLVDKVVEIFSCKVTISKLGVKRKIQSRTTASIEIMVLEHVMETPPSPPLPLCRIVAHVVVSNRPHHFPLSGKTGMEWEPFINF